MYANQTADSGTALNNYLNRKRTSYDSTGQAGDDYVNESRFTQGQNAIYDTDGVKSQSLYDSNSTDTDFINSLYQNEAGRAPDAEGAEWHQGRLDNGETRQDLVDYFNQAPEGLGYDSYLPRDQNNTAMAQTYSADVYAPSVAQGSSTGYQAGLLGDAAQTSASGYNATNTGNASTYGATNQAPASTVSKGSVVTSQDRMTGLLDENSEYMQDAVTKALQQQQARGLLNSSMAIGAGRRGAIQSALPMATHDSAAYNTAALFNAGAMNDVAANNAMFANNASAANAQAMNANSIANQRAQNQAAMANAAAQNSANNYNASAQNDFSQFNQAAQIDANRFGATAANQFEQNNVNALNNASQFTATAQNQAEANATSAMNSAASNYAAEQNDQTRAEYTAAIKTELQNGLNQVNMYGDELSRQNALDSLSNSVFTNALNSGIYTDTGDMAADQARIDGFWEQISQILPDAGRPVINQAIDETALAVI